jgi:hypothetical protein
MIDNVAVQRVFMKFARSGFARWLPLPRLKKCHDTFLPRLLQSDFLISILRSHATTRWTALPAIHSEPNLEYCQSYDDDADHRVNHHGGAILEAQ